MIELKCLKYLANLEPQPESVPINALVPVEGTPLQNQKIVEPEEMIIMIATARIIMPKSRIRLSAGRKYLSNETQMLCLLSGANSIFYGDSLLTTKNNDMERDKELIKQFKQINQSNSKELINKYLIIFTDKMPQHSILEENLIKFKFWSKTCRNIIAVNFKITIY